MEAKAAKEKKQETGTGNSSRLKPGTYDLTDDDPPVIKELTKFPTHRRIPVIICENMDGFDHCAELVRQGKPFIARPKRGRSILKVIGVPCLVF